jgi:uncharacterized protein (TIGR03435 family)
MMAILAMVLIAGKPGGAQQPLPLPPPNAGPPIGGGRGPSPFLGLSGWIDSPTSGPNAPRFEVASVKRNPLNTVDNPGGSRTQVGGAVRTTNTTLKRLIRMAYRLNLTDEIVGGPSWADTFGFDVDAKPAKPVTVAEWALMMRTLLAERFQLVVRKEPREGSIYALVLARRDGALGPQIKRSVGECTMVVPGVARPAGAGAANAPDPAKFAWPPPGRPGRRCGIGPDGGTVKAGSITMATLVTYLTPMLDRPVVDKTGLTGTFDLTFATTGRQPLHCPGAVAPLPCRRTHRPTRPGGLRSLRRSRNSSGSGWSRSAGRSMCSRSSGRNCQPKTDPRRPKGIRPKA